jgi:hypothetical protein
MLTTRNIVIALAAIAAIAFIAYCARARTAGAAPPTAASCPGPDQLGGPLTAAGVTTQAITGHGQSSFTFQVVATAGTATAGLVACCTGNCDTTTGNWSVIGTTGSLAAATPLLFTINWPSACLYAIQVTAPTGLTGAAWVACGSTAGGG